MLPDQVPDVLVVAQAQTEYIDHDCQGLEAVVAEVLHSRYSVKGLGPPSPDVELEASVRNRLCHRDALVAQSTKPIFSSDMQAFSTSGDQLEGEFPQAFCVTGIDGVGCVPPSKVRWAPRDLLRLIAILKVKTAD